MNARTIRRRMNRNNRKSAARCLRSLKPLKELHRGILEGLYVNLKVIREMVNAPELSDVNSDELAGVLIQAATLTNDLRDRCNRIKKIWSKRSVKADIYDIILECTDRYTSLSEIIIEQYATITDAIYVLANLSEDELAKLRSAYEGTMDEVQTYITDGDKDAKQV